MSSGRAIVRTAAVIHSSPTSAMSAFAANDAGSTAVSSSERSSSPKFAALIDAAPAPPSTGASGRSTAPGRNASFTFTSASWQSLMRYVTLRE